MKFKCKNCNKHAHAKDFDEIVELKKLCKVCLVHGKGKHKRLILINGEKNEK